jgi:acyl carrier protein
MTRNLQSPNAEGVAETVKEFILSNFLPGDPRESLQDDDLLLEGGIVDSAGVVSMIVFLEGHFGIQVLDEELFAENFATIERIASFIARKQAS